MNDGGFRPILTESQAVERAVPAASVYTRPVGQQLAEIEQLMETAESHAAKLRDRLSDGIGEEMSDVAQLSEVLDTILHLKLSKDLLERFALASAKAPIDELR